MIRSEKDYSETLMSHFRQKLVTIWVERMAEGMEKVDFKDFLNRCLKVADN